MSSLSDRSYKLPDVKPAPVRLIALAVLVGVVVGVTLTLVNTHHERLLFAPTFPTHGLVTNEYAFENPSQPDAVRSPDWEVTSGSLFGLNGNGWTGVIDGQAPDPQSRLHTDSSVFRLRTRRSDFNNVAVSFRLRVHQLVSTFRTPAQAYDGIHVWLRYQSPQTLYFVSVDRRDGQLVIGKKLNGTYYHSVRVPGHPFPLNAWVDIKITTITDGDKVVIRLYMHGNEIAHLTDGGGKTPAIINPGRAGIRGDNAEFEFQNFRVSTAS